MTIDDGEQFGFLIVGLIFGSLILCVLVVMGFAIFSDHSVYKYYLQTMEGRVTPHTCVIGQRNWVTDTVEVCYSNPNDALEAMQKLKH
jgi:hypothetical protein